MLAGRTGCAVPVPASAVDSSPDAQAAFGMLANLPIKGRAPKTGYDRDLFGQAWTDDVDVEFGKMAVTSEKICFDVTSPRSQPVDANVGGLLSSGLELGG